RRGPEAEELVDPGAGDATRLAPALRLELPQLDREGLALPVPDHLDPHLLTRLPLGEGADELRGRADRNAVQPDDDVADLEARLRRRGPFLHLLDLGACDLVQPVDLRIRGVDLLNEDAEPRPADDAVLDQVVGHLARDLDRDGEAVARVEPGGGSDRGVDADDAPGQVDQRAARVAGVDRRVRLDECLDRGQIRFAAQDPDVATL